MKKLFILSLSLFITSSCKKVEKSFNQTLNYPLSSEISTLDPANSYDVVSATVIYQVYETLFEYEYLKRPFTLKPLLAESMPLISEDGLTYTIKIKKGIAYHDSPDLAQGRTVKAQDFITQFKRLAFKKTNSQGFWLVDGVIQGVAKWREEVGLDLDKMLKTPISGLKASDDHTLVIKLTKPKPQFLYTLAMSFTSPMPAEVLKKYDNELREKLFGTGPFILKSWVPRSEIILSKNPNYKTSTYPTQYDRISVAKDITADSGKSLPFLNEIRFKIIKESTTRWLNFRKKKTHVFTVSKDQFSTVISGNGKLSAELIKENIQLDISPSLTYWWFAFNMKHPLLGANKNLRLAIAHAINTEKFIELFTNNTGQKANSIYPPGIQGYDPSRELPFKYDLNLAKSYLEKAGFPLGDGLSPLNYDLRGADTTVRQIGEFVKNELEKIGIKVNIIPNTYPAFLKKSKEGKLEFWLDGWALDYPDAENVLQLLTKETFPPGPNASSFSDPKFEELFKKFQVLEDGNEKFNLMNQMESIVLEELPWVMVYYRREYTIFQPELANFRSSSGLINNYFKYLKLKSSSL